MESDPRGHFEKIADGLADRGFALVDHFISDREVHAILQTDEFKNAKLHFKKAGIGKQLHVQEDVRGDLIQWIDPAQAPVALESYFTSLHCLIRYVNQTLFLSLKGAEVHMTLYPAGAFYRRHLDQFKADDHRKLSVICYLNSDWNQAEGGQLRMYLRDGPLDVLPLAGRLVCFRSDMIEHEVLPATRERMSLTGWLLDR